MYYKVIYKQRIIDVLDKLQYCKYQLKHRVLLLCDESEAQGILSSSGETAYHIPTTQPFPADMFHTVSIEEITYEEYKHLSRMCLKTPEQITEELIQELIERGVL